MTKTDKKLLIALSLLGLFILLFNKYFFLANHDKNQAIVKVQGEIVMTINLKEKEKPERYTVRGKLGNAVIEVKDHRISMPEAPCPDQICVKQGWIDTPGQSIICVPNEIVIYIDDEPGVDAITR